MINTNNNNNINKYSEIFKALGHPIRLKMVIGMLNSNECNVKDISKRLNIPQSTTSQHLAALKNAGIINYTKRGVDTCYYVNNTFVENIIKII